MNELVCKYSMDKAKRDLDVWFYKYPPVKDEEYQKREGK
jgi:hypothetical protein